MKKSITSSLRLSSVLVFLASLAACSSGAKIMADYDRSADFASYNTWNFFDDAGPDYQGYESLFTKYMLEAITIEMENRGYTKSDHPDLLVNFNAVVQDKTKVTQTQSMAPMGAYGGGGYYGYRGASYGAWGGYGYGTETHVSQYEEGTFNIDIVDAKQQQLVWEAVGIGRVTDKARENLRQTVMEGVPKFFASYPVVAGSGVAVEE
jgi:hypothetical protein